MKLLLFSDLHINKTRATEIVEKSRSADVVIGAGDFATVHRGLDIMADILKAINKPSVVVPGNGETFEELNKAFSVWRSCHVLHGSGVNLDGVDYYGIGGGVPVTPFGSWSYDFTEEEARVLLRNCPDQAILISHSPPRGILDVASNGQSLGSLAVKECIETKKPKLVVCGHIHESGGKKEMVEDTLVVNAGPKAMLVELF